MNFLHRNKKGLNTKMFSEADYVVLNYEQLLKVNGAGGGSGGGGGGGSPSGPSGTSGNTTTIIGDYPSGYGACGGGRYVVDTPSSENLTDKGYPSSTDYNPGIPPTTGPYTGSNEDKTSYIPSGPISGPSQSPENKKNLAEVKSGWSWVLGTKYSDSYVVTDDYGKTEERKQISSELNVSDFHHGVDIAAKEGERINSIFNGKVTAVTNTPELGISVVIEFEDHTSIRYSHCGNVNVSVGQSVVAGEQVATVGMTGVTTGPHVHISYDGDGDGSFYGNNYADNPNRVLFPGF